MGKTMPHAELALGCSRPFTNGRCYDILRPRPRSWIEGLCVNQYVYDCLTHWDPLLEKKVIHIREGCPHCSNLGKPRWYGYMPIKRPQAVGIEIVEISAFAGINCQDIVEGSADLRGQIIKVERFGNGRQGKVRCTFSPPKSKVKIPAPIPIREALLRAFGFVPEPCFTAAQIEERRANA